MAMNFEYLSIPAPANGLSGKGIKGTPAKFANRLTSVLNEHAREGWEFVRAETLPCEERSGFTSKTIKFQHVLIFRRALNPAVPEPVAPQQAPAPAPAAAPKAEPVIARVRDPDPEPAPDPEPEPLPEPQPDPTSEETPALTADADSAAAGRAEDEVQDAADKTVQQLRAKLSPALRGAPPKD